MTWPVVAVALAAALGLGVLAGLVRPRAGTLALVAVVAMVGLTGFMPGVCAHGIADRTSGKPIETTSCDTVYGAALPELGGLQEDSTGWLLVWTAAGLVLGGAVLTRRARMRVHA